MSFVALVLTLCTAVGSNDDACNGYYIDSFAGAYKVGQTVPEDKSMGDQWGDCMDRYKEELHFARAATLKDRAATVKGKPEVMTEREKYLKRFNIVEDVRALDTWDYSCVKLKENQIP